MPSTKQRILHTSEKLFFEYGIANARLQQIADETGISVGNLAYHFSNKEAIVEAVYQNLIDDLSKILVESKIYPGLGSFETKFSNLYQFMEKKIFYFINSWEIKRNYPFVNEKIQVINKKILLKLRKRIMDNVKRGVLKKEAYRGAHILLAKTLLLSINSWMPQQHLNERDINEKNFKKFLWGHIYPHFTKKGLREFESLIEFSEK